MPNNFLKATILVFCCFAFSSGQRRIPEEIIGRLIIRNINITVKTVEEYADKHNGNYPQTVVEFMDDLPTDFKNPVDSSYEVITDKDINTPGVILYKFMESNGYEITANDAGGNRLPYRLREKKVMSPKGTAVPVWCYFPKNGTQSPTGEPNWYYYWSQTSASIGEHIYDPTIGTPFMGEYHYGETFFRVGHLARTSIGESNGIDCFARVCLHENTHLEDWWGFWPNGYDSERDQDTTGNGVITGDQIPDDIEPSLGFDPTRAHTYGGVLDFTKYSEPRALQAEQSWINGSADYEDWSAPGKQYGGNIEE
ncbi:MAG: hypothetical protein ABIL18_05885 [candidate division WOR-3 bacterium]